MADFTHLPIKPGFAPMEAKRVDEIPEGEGWRYEPKWDGFRCLAFRDGDAVAMMSKSGKPLDRYFPEMVEMLRSLKASRLVIDGELVVPVDGAPSFDALQARLHPAESRIRKLSIATPAQYLLFDCLADPELLIDRPLADRRASLERFHAAETAPSLKLSEWTSDHDEAQRWLDAAGGSRDGVVAKQADAPYSSGERTMLKIKRLRSADCVVGGFRYATGKKVVGSLLLGLYDAEGRLNHVGFTSNPPDRAALTRTLEAIVEAPGFTGSAPGGPSRWSTDRSSDWQPLRPELVVEVRYDHVTGDRFRHGTSFLRWRPDKAPAQCGMEQLDG